jgi:hypothetical protein
MKHVSPGSQHAGFVRDRIFTARIMCADYIGAGAGGSKDSWVLVCWGVGVLIVGIFLSLSTIIVFMVGIFPRL